MTPSVAAGAAWLHSQAAQAMVTSTTDDVLGRAEAGAVAGVTVVGGWSVGLGLVLVDGRTCGSTGDR